MNYNNWNAPVSLIGTKVVIEFDKRCNIRYIKERLIPVWAVFGKNENLNTFFLQKKLLLLLIIIQQYSD